MQATNFAQFVDTGEVSLLDRGLLCVHGINEDAACASSNGAGKSNFLNIPTWVLFGTTSDETGSDEILRHEAPRVHGRVSILDTIANEEWEVSRMYETKGGRGTTGLDVYRGGKKINYGVEDGQVLLRELLGRDLHGYCNTVLYGSSAKESFSSLRAKNADRQLLLRRLHRLERFDRAKAFAAEKKRSVERAFDALLVRLQVTNAQLAEVPSLDAMETRRASLLASMNEIAGASEEAEELHKVIRSYEDIVATAERIQTELLPEIRSRLAATRKDLSLAEMEAANVRLALEEKFAELSRFEKDGACPTCGTATTARTVMAHLAALRAKAGALEAGLPDLMASIETLVKQRQDLLAKETEATKRIEPLSSWRKKLREAKDAMDKVVSKEARLAALQMQLEDVERQLAEAQKRKSDLHTAKLEAERLMSETMAELETWKFWVEGFGNTGIPIALVREFLPLLTIRTNHFLSILSDGYLRVEFRSQRELKRKVVSGDKALVDEISVRKFVGGKRATFSKAQSKMLDISTNLSFLDMTSIGGGVPIDFVAIDEMLDGVDDVGKTRMASLLRDLRGRRGTVLAVSHDSGIQEVFDGQIDIVLKGGVATVHDRGV
jgi:DNA repair exonuclease SbcCD ATPase subunit